MDNDDTLDYEDYLDQRMLMNLDHQSGTRLVRGVKLIHRNGIVVRDIHNNNVAHGQILDFSLAWTAPHPCFTPEMLHANKWRLASHHLSYADACAIDVMIDEWNERFGHRHKAGPIQIRLLQNTPYLKMVRPRKNPLDRREYGVRYRGEMYGWSASQKKQWKELCKANIKKPSGRLSTKKTETSANAGLFSPVSSVGRDGAQRRIFSPEDKSPDRSSIVNFLEELPEEDFALLWKTVIELYRSRKKPTT